MNTAAKKELRMRRLSPKEIGDYRLDIMSGRSIFSLRQHNSFYAVIVNYC